MNREQLWAQYAAAALSGMLSNEYSQNQQAMESDADTAGKYADAMLAEHLHRFPQDENWIEWDGGEWDDEDYAVFVRFRDGEETDMPLCASIYNWDSGEIIAYRLA